MNFTKELKQEWDVFCALSPERLIKLYQDNEIEYADYIKMISTLKALGFESLAEYFMLLRYKNEWDKTIDILTALDKLSLQAICVEYGVDLSEKNFVKIFTDNIKSEGLKDLFEKRADYFA